MSLEREIKVDLTLIDEGGRWVDLEPDGVCIGVVTLRGWEIHPVHASPEVLGEHDAYLIKLNYELDLGPDPIRMNWFEIGFAFSAGDGIAPVAVADALPRTGMAEETVYSLNRRLQFAPHTAGMGPDAIVPAISHQVTLFGVGGNRPRWRNMAVQGENVRSGSHAAWLSLFVPRGTQKVAIEFSVRYALPPEEILGSRPGRGTQTFAIALKDGARPLIRAAPTDDTDPARRSEGPRVFISYAHDTPWHEQNAIKFADLLAEVGVDVHMDKLADPARQNWWIWGEGEIKSGDFTTVVASPLCKAVAEGRVSSDRNRGIRAELDLIRELLSQNQDHWIPKILPVVLPGEKVENLPDFLQPRNCDHYQLHEFTEEEITGLLRAMGRTDSGEWPSRSR
ncbi:SEFIR domain-containing protein [Actinomadura sp. NEAU-AAG7]|uniref:SEFIR domain-containing protein n=1 Tax=Actinomadura sp. NEAU-AAG7 TaxID=2839640 RepID=UPI001BE41C83|nr:SEFIR domain-containing protein [Actinomadura sp. NEAU-AAG7]MBT2208732.1 hypothetical protein [Actinomadura sp. NEAU-AAG7]